MRDGTADGRNLPDHGALVGGLDRQAVLRRAERIDHSEGCGQRNLEPHIRRQKTGFASAQEILVGGAGLSVVAQLRKANIGQRYAVGKLERQEARGLVGLARIGFEERQRTKEGILPTDPQPAAPGLAIGDPPQPATEQGASRAKNFFHVVERDAADEMDPGGDHWLRRLVPGSRAPRSWLGRRSYQRPHRRTGTSFPPRSSRRNKRSYWDLDSTYYWPSCQNAHPRVISSPSEP